MRQNIVHDFKLALQQGRKVFGTLIGPGNEPEETVTAIKNMGFDYCMIDNEHSLVSKETIQSYINYAREVEIPILLRPEEHYANWRCFLDAGINGLMLPRISTMEEVAHAIEQAYFPPMGHRGSSFYGARPIILDGMDATATTLSYMTQYVNDNTMLFPQAESLTAVNNLFHILNLDGVTGTIVGTNDLILDMWRVPPDELRSELLHWPAVEEKLMEIISICRETGKVGGLGGFRPQGFARWAREGYQFFLIGYAIYGNVGKIEVVLKETRDLIGE